MSIRRSSALVILACSLAIPSFADSQARIVRLSQVDGNVQIDRNLGQGYEKAFINLPVTQGAKLRTGQDARAEIEFEDGSSLRLAPDSVVEFPELSRRDSGARASNVELQQGTAYLNFRGNKGEEFVLAFGSESLRLKKPSHLRVELKDASATVAVFNGMVEVNGASGTVAVEKKHTATFDLAGSDPYTLTNNLEPDPYDEWDKQQDRYHQQYSSNGFSPYGYGASDLNYYGSFYNMPGYGMMWQPYLVGAGWDPFMNGAWAWYPGAGYAWISSYPWGWTPYRYGSWTFVNSYGWFWQPGSSWTGWNTVPRVVNPPQHFNAPRIPTTPGQTLVVNRGAPVGAGAVIQGGSQIRVNSAGLGIARGSVRNLGRISQQVERPAFGSSMRGPAVNSTVRSPAGGTRVYAPEPSSAAPRASGGSAGSAPASHGPSHR
ncbi:MAG: FecR family protein [Terriglobales bacterium]